MKSDLSAVIRKNAPPIFGRQHSGTWPKPRRSLILTVLHVNTMCQSLWSPNGGPYSGGLEGHKYKMCGTLLFSITNWFLTVPNSIILFQKASYFALHLLLCINYNKFNQPNINLHRKVEQNLTISKT